MPDIRITRKDFLEDRQGRTFADVLNDGGQPFDEILAFFNDKDRQRRMEESEIHHNRPALAGVVRELESLGPVDQFLGTQHPRRTKRLRQVVGVLVRMIMEGRGWQKTGRKGSLGVRASCFRSNKPARNVPQYGWSRVLVPASGTLRTQGRHAVSVRPATRAHP